MPFDFRSELFQTELFQTELSDHLFLFQPRTKSIPFQQNPFSRVTQISLAAKLIHVVGYDLARGSDILRQQFMRKGNHLHGTVFGLMTEPFREADKSASKPTCDIVH